MCTFESRQHIRHACSCFQRNHRRCTDIGYRGSLFRSRTYTPELANYKSMCHIHTDLVRKNIHEYVQHMCDLPSRQCRYRCSFLDRPRMYHYFDTVQKSIRQYFLAVRTYGYGHAQLTGK